MARLQVLLDLLLALLLAGTLFHTLRLERSLRSLKRDRDALEGLLTGFGHSTRAAEAGIDKLRGMTEQASGQMARQAERGVALKDDLVLLIDRGDHLADRLEDLLRAGRPVIAEPPRPALLPAEPRAPAERPTAEKPRMRSQAERDLLNALKAPR